MRCMKWIFALFLAAAPAQAQPLQEGLIGAEIIQGGVDAQGRPLAAIALYLAPDWKTYWRAPGEGGLPPEFDWAGSQNLNGAAFSWPRPNVFESAGFVNFGYHGQLVLPFAITRAQPDHPANVALRLSFGLCKDICIPAEILLHAQISGAQPPHPAIVAALADLPIAADSAGLGAVRCRITPIDDGLRLTAQIIVPPHDDGAYHSVAVEHRAADIWISSPTTQRQGNALITKVDLVPPQAQPFALNGDDLRLTVLADTAAIDVQGCEID
jgi:DsbC/DsbD-like thiol-disulfide interchange protein